MKNKFPSKIPIFPLNGVIYFPKTNLPLNVFEQRYLDLVNQAIKTDKFMGMIQLKKNSNEVYKVGCLGKITDFQKSDDGRMLINLTGLIRFEIKKEIENKKKFREFEISYEKYIKDTLIDGDFYNEKSQFSILLEKTKKIFQKNGLSINWLEFAKLEELQQINTICMIAPFSNEEKQKLLETVSLEEKINTLINILEFYNIESYSENLQSIN